MPSTVEADPDRASPGNRSQEGYRACRASPLSRDPRGLSALLRRSRPISLPTSLMSGFNLRISLSQDIAQRKTLIVEGAGGVLVPINKTLDGRSDETACGCPCNASRRSHVARHDQPHPAVACRPPFAACVSVRGVILVGQRNRENQEAIERYGNIEVVGTIPGLTPWTARC